MVKVADIRRFDVAATKAAHVGDVARLEGRDGVLSVVAVGLDCRIQTVVPIEGDLPVVYIEADPLAKALTQRDSDRPVELRVTDTSVMLVHGEFRMRLPRVVNAAFDWQIREPDVWLDTAGLQDAIIKTAAIITKDDQNGILLERQAGSLLVASVKRGRHIHAIRLVCPGEGRFCMSRDSAVEVTRIGDLTGWGVADGSLLFRSSDTILRVSPIRDGFTRQFDDLFADVSVIEAITRTSDLVGALRAVSVVLAKEDEHVSLSVVGQVGPDTIFEVTTRSSMRAATASEKFLGQSMTPQPWSGTCNIKDLISTLAAVSGETVQLALGQKAIRLRDGPFRALLSLMVV